LKKKSLGTENLHGFDAIHEDCKCSLATRNFGNPATKKNENIYPLALKEARTDGI
jgi:hypothetical protein